MNDDYLWDPAAAPDPDVERLERLLGRLRTTQPAPALPGVVEPAVRWRTARFLLPTLAAAAAIVVMVGLAWRNLGTAASWEVERISGTPRIESSTLTGTGRLAVGQTLVTDAVSRARMDVSTIGQVDVDPDTRVRLVATRDGHHQLALERGTLHAVISAPPGQFIVDTPSAKATDLGCAYTLHVDEDGSGLLSVTAGLVAFDFNGRESFVPAGASCRTDPARGPGTPRFDDASEAFRAALDELDFGLDPARRADALRFVLGHSDTGDAVTLWHLIGRVGAADRDAVIDALADQVAMPPGVMREAVLRLDRAALDAWWDAMGLGDASGWRKLKQALP
jgi:FecR-like protein